MLRMQGVTKQFGRFYALRELNMTVPKGAIYGLVGPNGAGKSTALRHATGICRPDKGQVYFDGLSVYENPRVKSRIAYIPDEIFFFPSATLEDMRKFYRGMYPTFDDGLFTQLLDVFPQLRKTPISRYSKGMQKQAAFQLSLCTHPDMLVLDEPVDGLDPVIRRQVWSLIQEDVSKRGSTVLISSHNLRELEDLCDHVGIMERGKMIMECSLSQLQSSTVKVQLVGQPPAGLEILSNTTSGRLQTLVVRGSAQEITPRLQEANLTYFDVLPLTLEEIFIYELGGMDYEIQNILL